MFFFDKWREFRDSSGIRTSSQSLLTLAQLAGTSSWLWCQDFLVTLAHCRKPNRINRTIKTNLSYVCTAGALSRSNVFFGE
jgi:hypothetical protein